MATQHVDDNVNHNGTHKWSTKVAPAPSLLCTLAMGHALPSEQPPRSATHPSRFASRGVRSLAFVRRGAGLVSSSNDGTVRVADVAGIVQGIQEHRKDHDD